jgi:hypothetical protein
MISEKHLTCTASVVIINASGPPAIIMQNPEIMMNVKIPRITQFFHLQVQTKN